MLYTVRVHYEKLQEYLNKIGEKNIVHISSCLNSMTGEHFFTIVYKIPYDPSTNRYPLEDV